MSGDSLNEHIERFVKSHREEVSMLCGEIERLRAIINEMREMPEVEPVKVI